MNESIGYLLAADIILVIHFLYVLFVVVGMLLILLGKLLKWQWVHNAWFRVVHLLAIAIVVLLSWFGVICPLTDWEMVMRRNAGESIYAGDFVAHWLHSLLFFQAPQWVFTLSYSVFGLLVLISWFWVKPKFHQK